LAKQVALDYTFPMYVGENKYSEFVVTIQYEDMSNPVELLSDKSLDIPGASYLKGILANIDNKEALKEFINKKRKIKYTSQDFSFLFPGLTWLENANSISVKGHTQIGRYSFLILSVDNSTKVITLENSRNNFQIPKINENHFSYMLPTRALIGALISGKVKSSNINKKNQNCMIRNVDSSCNLFLNAKVNKYIDSVRLQNDPLTEFIKNINENDFGNLFSDSFGKTDKQSYINQFIQLSPLVSIEFPNSVIAYFGKMKAGKMEISRLIKFRKNNNSLRIQIDSKFNDIDRVFSNSVFIKTLLAD
jgi:hypothetical protein